MTRLEVAPEVLDDFDRFFDHISELGAAADASQRISDLISALDILAHSPLIGRKVKGGNRELVSGRSSRGYVALCRSCLTSTPSSCLPCAANPSQTTSAARRRG